MRTRQVFVCALVIFFFSTFVFGFGKNKVQYHKFKWHYFETVHFKVFFTEESEEVAQFTAQNVETIYQDLSQKIDHEIVKQIPIIVHSNHIDFEQTNVINLPLHEGIGGFTTIMSNKVVLPFEGNYVHFYEVLKHELVHALLNDLVLSFGKSSYRQHFPLWLNEGLAEYLALGWDIHSDAFLMSAIHSGYVTNPANGFEGYLNYKGGQSFWSFLHSIYGDSIVPSLLKYTLAYGDFSSFPKAFRKTTQVSLEEMGAIWIRELKKIYLTEFSDKEYAQRFSRKLTHSKKDLSLYNLQPIISPNGKKVAFFSDRSHREALFVMDVKTEEIDDLLIESGTQAKQESFHAFKSRFSWGPNSKRIVISSKNLGKDNLKILDAKNGKVLESIDVGLGEIRSPHWSSSGRYIVFNRILKGQSDIFLWDLKVSKLKRITNDYFFEGEPILSPSEEWIYFHSNRETKKNAVKFNLPQKYGGKYFGIYRYSMSKGNIEPVIEGDYNNKQTFFCDSESSFIFTSNRSGISNLYVAKKNKSKFSVFPLTNLIAGAGAPSCSKDGKNVVFSVFEGGTWDIYIMKNPMDKLSKTPLKKTYFVDSEQNKRQSFFRKINIEYFSSFQKDTSLLKDTLPLKKIMKTKKRLSQRKKKPLFKDSAQVKKDTNNRYFPQKYGFPEFHIENLNGGIGFSSYSNIGIGGGLSFGDLLGDHKFHLGLSGGGNLKDNIYASLGYDYLPYKFDYSLGGVYYRYKDDVLYNYENTYISSFISVRLPFSLYTRLEISPKYDYYVYKTEDSTKKLKSVSLSTAWTFDNVQWILFGPTNGERIKVSSLFLPPYDKEHSFILLDIDARKYFLFNRKNTLALRANIGFSQSLFNKKNPHLFLVGGSDLYFLTVPRVNRDNIPEDNIYQSLYHSLGLPLRGYPVFEFSGNKKILLNAEFRYPFASLATAVLFMDYGAAWTKQIEFDNSQGIGVGFGIHFYILGYIFRWNRGMSTNWVGNNKKEVLDHWSLGSEF